MQARELAAKIKKKLMQQRPVQRLAAAGGRDLAPRQWVFLLGCYNSGTTLVRDILARHPQIAALPSEGVRLTDALPRPEDFGWPRMWCRCLDGVRLDPEAAGADRRAERARRHWSYFYPPAGEVFLEKSIAHAARLGFMAAHFRPAYFVYLVRNGYAVAEGIRRKADPAGRGNTVFNTPYPIELCAEQWLQTDRLVRADAAAAEHFLQLSYEAFAADPAGQMRRVTDFLGLQPLPAGALGGDWTVHGVQSPIRDMNAASFGRLAVEEAAAIEQVAGEALARYGYGRPDIG